MGLPSTLMAVEWFIREVLYVSWLLATWAHDPFSAESGAVVSGCEWLTEAVPMDHFWISQAVVLWLLPWAFWRQPFRFIIQRIFRGQCSETIWDWSRMVHAISWYCKYPGCLEVQNFLRPFSSPHFLQLINLWHWRQSRKCFQEWSWYWDCVFKGLLKWRKGKMKEIYLFP